MMLLLRHTGSVNKKGSALIVVVGVIAVVLVVSWLVSQSLGIPSASSPGLPLGPQSEAFFDRVVERLQQLAPATGPMTLGEPAISIDIRPQVLSRRTSKGKLLKVYIELPPGQDVRKIDWRSVRIEDILKPMETPTETMTPAEVGDYDNDGRPDMAVAFDAGQVAGLFSGLGDHEIKVTGEIETFLFTGNARITLVD